MSREYSLKRVGEYYYPAYLDVESEECFQIGASDVCRAKMKLFTPSGSFVTVVVAPDSMSSVSLAEEEMLHFSQRMIHQRW